MKHYSFSIVFLRTIFNYRTLKLSSSERRASDMDFKRKTNALTFWRACASSSRFNIEKDYLHQIHFIQFFPTPSSYCPK